MIPRSLVLVCATLFLAAAAPAQPTAPVDTFDLVLVGDHLSPETHTVALRTNPSEGERWTSLDDATCTDTESLLVMPGIATDHYLGQDIRENHLSLRVTTDGRDDGALRAVYAVPQTDNWDAATCSRLARLVTTEPQTVRRHSLAVYERPRPATLSSGTPLIENVEAPVRHRKPGVMEVEWLEILFE